MLHFQRRPIGNSGLDCPTQQGLSSKSDGRGGGDAMLEFKDSFAVLIPSSVADAADATEIHVRYTYRNPQVAWKEAQ